MLKDHSHLPAKAAGGGLVRRNRRSILAIRSAAGGSPKQTRNFMAPARQHRQASCTRNIDRLFLLSTRPMHEWLASESARQRDVDRVHLALPRRALMVVEGDEASATRVHVALAKLYEHQSRDYDRALFHTQATADRDGKVARDVRLARIRHKHERRRGRRALKFAWPRLRSVDRKGLLGWRLAQRETPI